MQEGCTRRNGRSGSQNARHTRQHTGFFRPEALENVVLGARDSERHDTKCRTHLLSLKFTTKAQTSPHISYVRPTFSKNVHKYPTPEAPAQSRRLSGPIPRVSCHNTRFFALGIRYEILEHGTTRIHTNTYSLPYMVSRSTQPLTSLTESR